MSELINHRIYNKFLRLNKNITYSEIIILKFKDPASPVHIPKRAQNINILFRIYIFDSKLPKQKTYVITFLKINFHVGEKCEPCHKNLI